MVLGILEGFDMFQGLYKFDLLRFAAFFDLGSEDERIESNKCAKDLFIQSVLNSNIKNFFEIGANQADVSISIKRNNPDINVVAFEANPYNFRHYSDRFDYVGLGVDYRQCAVSDVDGPVKFRLQATKNNNNVSRIRGNNSLLTRCEDGVEYEDVFVRSFTLDSIVSSLSGDVACWIDVEGANSAVLLGCKQVLQRIKLVHIEVEDRQFWRGQWLSTEVIDFFREAGFVPIFRDFEYQDQYNIIFAHSDLFGNLPFNRNLSQFYSKIAVRFAKYVASEK